VLVAILVIGIGFFVFTGEAKAGETEGQEQESIEAECNESAYDFLIDEDTGEIIVSYEGHEHIAIFKDETTKEMWTEYGDGSRRIISETLQEEVIYEELIFTDHIRLEQNKGKGWLLDLDGDGVQEKIYYADLLLYINGELIQTVWNYEEAIWILDIDTTDGVYEILSERGVLLVYEEGKLVQTWNLVNHVWKKGQTYQGNLDEFVRIDEHTISFEDICYQGEKFSGRWKLHYQLNDNHEPIVVQEICDVENSHMEVYLGVELGDEPLMLYAEPNKNSEVTEVTEFFEFNVKKVDGKEWIYIKSIDELPEGWTEDIMATGIEGWLYFPNTWEYIGEDSQDAMELTFFKNYGNKDKE